jgi:folate-dependent phosphoribosylglycinamide formyltransferase PurN
VPAKPTRPGAAKGKKGPNVGTGGHGRKRLEGKGPTPKAEDRKGHKAFRAKKSADKKKAAGVRVSRKGEFVASGPKTAGVAGAAARKGKRITKASESFEVLSGRNSVLEALRAKIPATALYLASRIEMDDRVKEALTLANLRKIPINMIRRFPNKIINIHPSLLPKYGGKGMYGKHVHEAVIASGDLKSGITIHLVDELYDHGAPVFMAEIPVMPGETPDTLAVRIHELEHRYFPGVIEKFVLGSDSPIDLSTIESMPS